MAELEHADTNNEPGAARTVWAAAVLFARTSGMNAANAERQSNGYAIAYGDAAFESVIADCWQIAKGLARP